MAINKGGAIFTIVTIAIISLFFLTYGAHTLIQDHSSTDKRINTLNNFVDSVEIDLSRQIFISGYRAIFIIDKKTLDTGSYIADVNNSVSELFFNSTLNGEFQDLMEDATFSEMQDFLSGNADKINANIQLFNPSVSIKQKDPWNLEVELNMTMIIEDKGDLVKWNRSVSITSEISVTNFIDPLYHIGTSGRVTNEIEKTPYETFVTGTNYTNLTLHFTNSYYKASASAPSFYDRLEGNFSANPNGIESLVYPQKLVDEGISAKYKSVVDYIYFSNDNPAKYTIPPVSNLILDNEDGHLAIYNVSGVAVPA